MHANVNACDIIGRTPLHIASFFGRFDVVCILLDAGANVDVINERGQTPLYCVIYKDRLDIARLLLDRGAKMLIVLDKQLPSIPDWVNTFAASRLTCRCVAVIIIGIHKYHRTKFTGNNDINVLKLISKHIWSSRMDDTWIEAKLQNMA
jgi:ankyrin repeat protein